MILRLSTDGKVAAHPQSTDEVAEHSCSVACIANVALTPRRERTTFRTYYGKPGVSTAQKMVLARSSNGTRAFSVMAHPVPHLRLLLDLDLNLGWSSNK